MKLELGVFDSCFSRSETYYPEYASAGKCWAITSVKGKVKEIKVKPEKPVVCPVFPVSYADGSCDSKANRDKFRGEVELTVLKEIERIHKTISKPIDLKKLAMPIKKELSFETNRIGELSANIELGIMVFE